jgi:hypothetical protein
VRDDGRRLFAVLALVGTEDGLVAIRDDDEPRVELDGSVTALRAIDGGGCWALVDRRALARRGDDGAWVRTPVAGDAPITALLPRGDHVLVGTADARVLRVEEDTTALEGFGRVGGRDAWHAVGSRTPYVRSLSATADGAVLLACVHVGGVPRSTDDGATWAPTVDVESDVHEVRAHPDDPRVVMAAAAVGLLESDDGGASWSPTPATGGLHATYLRALAFPTGSVLVGASDGPFGRRAALYRRPLVGGTFERCTDGLPEWLPAIADTGTLDARGDEVVAAADDAVFASADGGRRWRVLADGLPRVRAVAVLDPTSR